MLSTLHPQPSFFPILVPNSSPPWEIKVCFQWAVSGSWVWLQGAVLGSGSKGLCCRGLCQEHDELSLLLMPARGRNGSAWCQLPSVSPRLSLALASQNC